MTELPGSLTMHRVDRFEDLDPRTWYRIAQLRQQVFVVEQECARRSQS